MDIFTVLFRISLTFIASLLFGLERQRAHKPTGFGTFIFVSIGACALAITSITLAPDDPQTLLAATVTGIGFLGAGALVRTTDKIFGFTTAAAIWVFAILGLLLGTGEYIAAGGLYFLMWAVIGIDRMLERRGVGSYQRKMAITTNKIISTTSFKEIFDKNSVNYRVIDYTVDKTLGTQSIACLIEGRKEDINRLPQDLLKEVWLASCRIE